MTLQKPFWTLRSPLFVTLLFGALAWVSVVAPAHAANGPRQAPAPIIVFMTDYGTLDDAATKKPRE